MKQILLILFSIFFFENIFSQKFIEVKSILPQLNYSQVGFIDYDCDNDLDICVWGEYKENSQTYRDLVLYKNIGADQFEKIRVDSAIIYSSTVGSINAADINNDNIPEVASIGKNSNLNFTQYDKNVFKQLKNNDINNIKPISDKGAWFSDFDNDGSEEILVNLTLYDNFKKIYPAAFFDNIYNEWARWIDMNNDGKEDILRIHREQYSDYSTSSIYINNGGSFSMSSFNYTQRPWAIETGDYDNDGYEDLIIFSYKDIYASQPTAELFRNDLNNNFTYIKDIGMATSGRFVDIDNDGDLDIVLLGSYEVWNQNHLKFFRNNGNNDFIALANDSLTTDSFGDICVGDYDNDSDNDILISSYDHKNIVSLFKNQFVDENPVKANHAPSTPQGLKNEVSFNHVKLSWDKSTDTETPSATLTYNVFIKRSDGTFVTSPNADLQTGFKRILSKGNSGFKDIYEVNCLEDGKYYWSVQAVDNSDKGSPFSVMESFEIKGTMPSAPTELVAKTLSSRKIQLEWKDNSGIEDGFLVEMYSDSIPDYRAAGFYPYKTIGADSTFCDIDNLSPNTCYIFRVRSFNCSSSSIYTNTDTACTYPPPFTKKIILDNSYGREAEWGDFDRDGKLDILVFYSKGDAYGQSFTRILENKSDTLTELEAGLPKVEYFGSSKNGAANWFDFNSDGLLDICLIDGNSYNAKLKIFRNNGNKTFTDIKCDSILGITPGSCGPSFADFDNDGDLDILLMGEINGTFNREIRIYENRGTGKFVNTGIDNIKGIIKSRMPWCDFNNDGYQDILANEPKSDGTFKIAIYKNNGDKTFTKIVFDNLAGLNDDDLNQAGDMRWGDYNNDGFADILITGAHTGSNGIGITKVYRNNGDVTFTDVNIGNVYGMAMDASIEWGDFNNDGILDILQTGDGWIDGVAGKTRIYYNNNGSFVKEPDDSFLGSHQAGMSTAADFDNDGDLDILDLGEVSYSHNQIALFKNYQFTENTRPAVPSNLHFGYQGNETILSWDGAQDDTTPGSGLSYNVYLVNDSGTIIAPAALKSGKRTLVGIGNAQYNGFLKIKNLKTGFYRWSVQSIDNCFEGSEFAPESSINILNTGISNENNCDSQLTIYPNPFFHDINIVNNCFENSKCDITISDLLGRIIICVNDVALPYHMDTSSLNSGIYIMALIRGNSSIVKKIIKK